MKAFLALLLTFSVQAESLYFDFDKSDIKDEKLIIALADRARETRSKIIIVGSACSVGDRLYNLSLGQRRANAVRDALITAGLSPNQVEIAVSYGEEQPQSDTLAANRRVDVLAVEGEILHVMPVHVTVDQRPRSSNNLSVAGGVGPSGVDQDSLSANSFRVDPEYKPVFGLGFTHTFESQFSLGVLGFTNNSYFGTFGYSF